MIINIRGTHGSGKSTIVREVMKRYSCIEPQFVSGRKRPIGYRCTRAAGRPLWVVGHYETACGGCDTITSVDTAYEQIRKAAVGGHDVIFEGILVGHDVRRCIELHTLHGHGVEVILLTTPFEDCLQAARARRAARGDERHLKADNLQKRAWAKSLPERMQAAGIVPREAGRSEAAETCYGLLGLGEVIFQELPCSTQANTLF